MEVKEALTKARDLIKNPDNWLRGQFSNSLSHSCKDAMATKFCAAGALMRVVPYSDGHKLEETYYEAREKLSIAMGWPCVSSFNDTHTHREVIAAFNTAINS